MILLLGLLVPAARAGEGAEPVEWRALGGAQVDSDSHGELDLGVRGGPWVAEIYTDTLDLRWAPTWERGRASLGARAEAFAAGLLITPWTEGAPDPERALAASYAGPQASLAWYLPGGTWVGVDAHARYWAFGAADSTTISVPDPHVSARGSLSLGWWTAPVQAQLTAGLTGAGPAARGDTLYQGGEERAPVHAVGAGIAPHVLGEVHADPGWLVSPLGALRLGYEGLESAVYAPRVGGQVPYVVPLAGAAWAEFQAESYIAARAAVAVGRADAAPGSGAGAMARGPSSRLVARGWLGADIVEFTSIYLYYQQIIARYNVSEIFIAAEPQIEGPHLGLFTRLELRRGRAWGQLEGGYSPTLTRQPGVSPASALLRLGIDWGTGAPW